jgi:excisionase family DNA binding protein
MNNKLYKLPEVAKILKVSDKTIYRWIAKGKIKATKPLGQWRVSQEELNRLLK